MPQIVFEIGGDCKEERFETKVTDDISLVEDSELSIPISYCVEDISTHEMLCVGCSPQWADLFMKEHLKAQPDAKLDISVLPWTQENRYDWIRHISKTVKCVGGAL